MVATKSNNTIRLRGLDRTITAEQVQQIANNLAKSKEKGFPSSLALQGRAATATITFTPEEKRIAKEQKDILHHGTFDDEFDDITILHAPEEPEIDICAVHGLNGNAFGSWTANNGKMWLRDFLPFETPFSQSRIMIFGYNSTLVNSHAIKDRLQDYADALLHQIRFLRTTASEQNRPLLLICHSMGGLVARLAMTRLYTVPQNFPGLVTKKCGLLFLSTPHSGSREADWSNFLIALGEGLAGLRGGIIRELQSFNPASVYSTELFSSMDERPVFECLCEWNPTSIGGKNRIVVTQDSAGFLDKTAVKVVGTDHHTICKFETQFKAYQYVLNSLNRIRSELLMRATEMQQLRIDFSIPGRPNVTAHSFPLAANQKYYLGVGQFGERQFVGRASLVNNIDDLLKKHDMPSRKLALVGIGGIGKTEVLLKVASLYRNKRNIFFLPTSDATAFQAAFSDMARVIGHDALRGRHSYADLHQIWTSLSESGQAQEFQNWLSSSENQESVIILDDLDGLQDDELIKKYLPREANIVLYSTRDPTLPRSRHLRSQAFLVPNMANEDIKNLVETEMYVYSLEALHDEVEKIAKIVDGHPLAACRAVSYMAQTSLENCDTGGRSVVQSFIHLFQSQDWESRLDYLNHKPHFDPSIQEAFETSLARLSKPEAPSALQLLEAIAFLCGPMIDYRGFFSIERPWLDELKSHLPNYDVFATGLRRKGDLLQALEKVSLGFRPNPNAPLRIHSLWLECIRHRCGHDGQICWLKQILTICYETVIRNPTVSSTMRLYAENCLKVAWMFRIDADQLALFEDVRRWVFDVSDSAVITPE